MVSGHVVFRVVDLGRNERFKETLELFFEAVNIQARAREEGVIPDLECYIDIRRETSGKLTNSFIEHLVPYFFRC